MTCLQQIPHVIFNIYTVFKKSVAGFFKVSKSPRLRVENAATEAKRAETPKVSHVGALI